MSMRRVMKVLSIGLFVLGAFAIVGADGVDAANKQEDAKKFHEQLKTTKDVKKKIEALEELGKLSTIMASYSEAAIPDIAKALEDKDAGVRKAAAISYGKSSADPKDAVPALTKLLKEDKSEDVKIGAAQGLAAMGSNAKDALGDLRDLQKSEDKKSKLGRAAGEAVKAIAGKKK